MEGPLIVDVHLDLNRHDGFTTCISNLVRRLTNHPQHMNNVYPRPLLPKQEAEKPRRWMYVHLTAVERSTTLAVRDDNVYVIGFRNQSGKWYELGTQGMNERIINDTSTFLGCDLTYASLLVGHRNTNEVNRRLVDVRLGKRCAVEAVCNLSSYNTDGVAGTETKRHLACLILMISESTRMLPHYDTVTDGWDSHATLDDIKVKYLHNWGNMSSAIMGRVSFSPTLQAIGITDIDSACRVVRLLLNIPPARTSSSAGQGRAGRTGGGGGGGGGRRGEDFSKGKSKEKKPPASRGRSPLQQEEDEDPTKTADQDLPQQLEQEEQTPTSAEQSPPQHQDEQEQLPIGTELGLAAPLHGESEGEEYYYDEDEDDDDEQDYNDDPINEQLADLGGHLLVEVFSVRAVPGVVGTISVFDGQRGQIIYNPDVKGGALNDTSSQVNLALTGLYKAISAGGRVAIKIRGIPATDPSENVFRAMIWDGYDDKAEYNKIVTQSITTCGGQNTELTFAVLSNAVEATVQVQLKLSTRVTTDNYYFHGKITANIEYFDNESIMLFSRNEKNKLELVPSPDSFIIPVPLPRSVIVAPLYSSLTINLELCAECPPNHEETIFFGDNLVFPRLQQHTIMKEIERSGVAVQVTITSDDIQPLEEEDNTVSHGRSNEEEINMEQHGRPNEEEINTALHGRPNEEEINMEQHGRPNEEEINTALHGRTNVEEIIPAQPEEPSISPSVMLPITQSMTFHVPAQPSHKVPLFLRRGWLKGWWARRWSRKMTSTSVPSVQTRGHRGYENARLT